MNEPTIEVVLGIHATDRGFGWVVFDVSPIDWGTVEERGSSKNERCLARIEQIVARYEPTAIVLEEFEGDAAGRATRIRRLCRSIARLANKRGIVVATYSRAQIRACFANAAATSRYEIAQVIAERIEAFEGQAPPIRKPWLNEYSRMALFNAVATTLTHLDRSSPPNE